jgi:hypothetical protein
MRIPMKNKLIQPRKLPALKSPAAAVGAMVLGALAVGALAIGAIAIARLAVGGLAIKRARINTPEVDELTVRRLRMREGEPRKRGHLRADRPTPLVPSRRGVVFTPPPASPSSPAACAPAPA